jgi:hypothetical protein
MAIIVFRVFVDKGSDKNLYMQYSEKYLCLIHKKIIDNIVD